MEGAQDNFDMRKRDREQRLTEIPIPNTSEIEKQVLCELLLNTNIIQETRGVLSKAFFHDEGYAKTYAALCEMDENGECIDLLTLSEKVGLDYVTQEFVLNAKDSAATDSAIIRHCYILREAYMCREAYMFGLQLMQQSAKPGAEAQQIVAMIDRFKANMDNATKQQGTVSLSEAFDSLREAIEGGDNHITTGFPLLDDLTYGGWDAGNLIILAARPSVGKTAVALYMALQAAKSGKKAHFYSIEMTKEELAQRYLFAAEGNISPLDISRRTIDWREYQRIEEEYKNIGIFINDRINSIDGLVAEIIRQYRSNNLDVAFIDYLQLIKDISQTIDGKAAYIGMVTSRLKELAKSLGISIVALSQLNRKSVENGTKRAPYLADLRDSGSIEQDADIVLMLDPRMELVSDFDSGVPVRERTMIDMWVRKNRGGTRDVAVQLETNSTHTVYDQIGLITEK